MEQLRIARVFAGTVEADAVDPVVVAAFRDACESQLDAVFSYVRYRVESADVAEELTSATFAKALERLRSFDPGRGAMAHWIVGIARHLVVDHLRARHRWTVVPIDWLVEPSSAEATPERALADSELQHELTHALRRLRHRDRDVLGMKFGADLTNREIARVTGLREGHVAVLLRRALSRLKRHLESRGVNHA